MVKVVFWFFIVSICLITNTLSAAERIVSLKPNITDILLRLGVTEELVGVTTYCVLPASMRDVARVSDYIKPNLEKVVAARPTLILSSKENSAQKEIERLTAMGYRIRWVSFRSLADIYVSIRSIAAWTSRKTEGERLVHHLDEALTTLQAQAKTRSFPKRILLVVGQSPLVAVGGGTVFQDFFAALGFDNVLVKSTLPYPQISQEQLVSLDPDWILDVSASDPSPLHLSFYERTFSSLRAVREKRVVILPARAFLPGPPLWEGFAELLRHLDFSL